MSIQSDLVHAERVSLTIASDGIRQEHVCLDAPPARRPNPVFDGTSDDRIDSPFRS